MYVVADITFAQPACPRFRARFGSFMLFLFFSCFLVPSAQAQVTESEPDSLLARLSRVMPDEIAYVQTDKSHYFPGDTVWFKGYIMQGGIPSTLSTTLLADMADANGKLVRQTKWPMIEGSAAGFFSLHDIKEGTYQFRVYTPWMMNQDTAFFFKKTILVVQPQGKPIPPSFDFQVQFLPEGGHFVAGVVNNLAFIAQGNNGKPAAVTGKIVDQTTQEEVIEIQSLHDGMGSIMMVPQVGSKYAAVLTCNGIEKTIPLPEAQTNKLSLRVQQHSEQLFFQLQAGENFAVAKPTITILGNMGQQTVYKAMAKSDKLKEGVSGRIPVKNLPVGVLVLTIFGDNMKPLAERVVFVHHDSGYKALTPMVGLKTDTLTANKRALNVWHLEVPAGRKRNLSLSITDESRVPGPQNEENILSRLLISGEIKGKLYNAGYYLNNPYDSVKRAIDLVTLTHGWRKYTWETMARGFYPPVRVKPSEYLTLQGDVLNASGRKSLPNQELMLFLTGKDSSRQFLTATTDFMGNFKIPGYVFFDTMQVFYQLNKSKGDSKDVQIRLNPAVITLMQPLPPLSNKNAYILEDTALLALRRNQKSVWDRISGDKNTLAEVVVKAKKKTPLQELEERYTNGLFRSDNGVSFDLVNDPPPGAFDILTFLQGRVAGLQITGNGPNASATYRGGPPSFFLDEIPTGLDQIQNIPITDVALVKVLRPPFFGAAGGGGNGAIAVYTKKGNDQSSSVQGLEKTTIAGYNTYKEFYSPNYKQDADAMPYGDYRSTLLWMPYVFVDDKETMIPIRFYNNDQTTSFRVVVEGVDAEGKIYRMEKTVKTQ